MAKSDNDSPVQVEVVREEVDAQVAPPREPDADKTEVHEVSVQVDKVITDPSSPEAVQVPEEGRGSTDLPIHQLQEPSPEQALESGDAKPAEEGEYQGTTATNEDDES